MRLLTARLERAAGFERDDDGAARLDMLETVFAEFGKRRPNAPESSPISWGSRP